MTPSATSLPASGRLPTLDILRGFAPSGILIMIFELSRAPGPSLIRRVGGLYCHVSRRADRGATACGRGRVAPRVPAQGSTAVTSISTFARSSISADTSIAVIATA